ncbi:MAG: sortase [Thermoleophilaceae bacterium]|nr:sortase [Thermoleophilaceae bacterium]
MLIVTGVLLVLDAALTVIWQEPVTAIYGQVRQNELRGDLNRLEKSPLQPSEQRVLKLLHDDPARIAFLARSMRRRIRDGQGIGRIRISRIHASYVMVEGTSAGSLRKGPGHYPATPLPGMPGTVAIAGHRTTYLAPFNKLNKLHKGDQVTIEMPYALVTYRVEQTRIVPPTALWVTKRIGYDRLVLTACHPKYSAAKRIAVFARQVSAQERGVSVRIR